MGCRPKVGFPESVEVGLEHPPAKPSMSLSTSLWCEGERKVGASFFLAGVEVECMDVGVAGFTLGIPRWPGWWNKCLRQEDPSSS